MQTGVNQALKHQIELVKGRILCDLHPDESVFSSLKCLRCPEGEKGGEPLLLNEYLDRALT